MRIAILLCISLACPFVLAAPDLEAFLKSLSSPDESVRRAAWEGAAAQGAAAIGPLALLASTENREAALAASRAIERIAHASAAPGAPGRKDAAAALAGLLESQKVAEAVQVQALDLLGSVGEADVAPALARALADTKLRDFARKALERIPGEASEKALEAALDGASGELREALIVTLGNKRARRSVGPLLRIVKEEGEHARAAAAALARIGDASTVDAIEAVIKALIQSGSPRDAGALADDLLKMADELRSSGDPASARRIRGDVLVWGDDARRYAALFAIYADGSEKDTGALLAAVDDPSPRLRAQALELLSTLKDRDTDRALLERFAGAQGARKAAFLRVLAARKAPGIEKLMAAAASDRDVDVRVTALELSGKLLDAANEPVLFEALEKGSPPVRDVAASACLDLADAIAARDAGRAAGDAAPAAGAVARAVAIYTRVLKAAEDPREKGRALLGLGRAADPASLSRIEAARKDPALAASANHAYALYATALGRSGRKEEAIAMLQGVLASAVSRETAQAAVAGLRDLGGDPSVLQKKQGLLVSWRLMGPFPNKEGKGFDAAYSPEQELRFDGTQKDDRGRDRKWQELTSTSLDGKVDLRQAFQRSTDVCAYAYAEVDSPEARAVRVKIGSDDGVICWLNGKKVHANNAIRGWTADEDVADARLEPGTNRILLKITQGGGEWEFSFRITDRQDRPLDLTAMR